MFTGHRREEGAVAIMVALLLVVFMAAVALTVDVGGLYLRRRALVNGSDAAALSAARTCSRGVGNDPQFASAEEAADVEVQANAPITSAEVAGTNLTYPPPGGCAARTQYGHATVQYTSDQSLYFAPVLGFNHESPVTTTATASWGLGSNNPIPLIMSGQLLSTCPKPPPTGTNTIGQDPCGTWYDNDTLNDGNFGFLTLNAAGWDVPGGDVPSDCSGASAGGSDQLGRWISGQDPASVAINWTYPTYVCAESGLKGNSNPWAELQKLADAHAIRDFPIVWEGCGTPPAVTPCPPAGSAISQAPVYHSGNILKYDVIGFAALQIDAVLTVQQAQGTTTTTQVPWPSSNYSASPTALTLNTTMPKGSILTYTWTGHLNNGNVRTGTCVYSPNADVPAGVYAWSGLGNGNQCPGGNVTIDATPNPISITIPVTTTTYTPCGPPPPGSSGNGNSSARCVVTEWHGSTLTGDYDQNKDNITVVRLCDLAYTNSCLDQRPH